MGIIGDCLKVLLKLLCTMVSLYVLAGIVLIAGVLLATGKI